MIDWKVFDEARRAGDFVRARDVVSGGDGTPVLGDAIEDKCFECGQLHPAHGPPTRLLTANCPDCGEVQLKRLCRTHVSLKIPWFAHLTGNRCDFCELGVPVLNGVTSVECLQAVRDVFVKAGEFEKFGTLLIELRKAIASGNEKRMAEIHSAGELQSYPAASGELRIAEGAEKVIALKAQFRKLKTSKDYDASIALWDKHKAILQGRKSTEQLGADVNNWRRLKKLVAEILELWAPAPDSRRDPRLVRIWKKSRGDMIHHPLVKTLVPQIDHRCAQQNAWSVFEDISSVASAQLDQQRVDAWKSELFDDGWPPADKRLDDLSASRKRLKINSAFNTESKRSDACRESEARIRDLAAQLPSSYLIAEQRSRLKLADTRLAALKSFETRVAGGDERGIVAAWSKLDGEDLRFGSAVEQPHRDRKDAAMLRAPLVEQLAGMPADLAVDQRDEWIQKVWKDKILHDCKDPVVLRSRPLFTEAVERGRLLRDLKSAIASLNDATVVEIAGNSLLEGYPLGVFADRVAEAKRNLITWQEIKKAIDSSDADRFRELFDRRLFQNAKFLEGLRSRRKQIKALAIEALVPNRLNGLRAAFFGGLVDKGGGALKVEWGWPDRRFSDKCLLCVCNGDLPEGNLGNDNDNGNGKQVVFEQTVVRAVVESGDGSQPLQKQAGWAGGHVAVRCVLDLGCDELKSEWLDLGQIE